MVVLGWVAWGLDGMAEGKGMRGWAVVALPWAVVEMEVTLQSRQSRRRMHVQR